MSCKLLEGGAAVPRCSNLHRRVVLRAPLTFAGVAEEFEGGASVFALVVVLSVEIPCCYTRSCDWDEEAGKSGVAVGVGPDGAFWRHTQFFWETCL